MSSKDKNEFRKHEKTKKNVKSGVQSLEFYITVEQHSLKDQIAMDRYLASKLAMKRGRGFRVTKMKSGGASC